MKGIILGLVVLTLVSVTSAEKCKIFKCKGWFTPMEEDVCLQYNPESGSKQLVTNCKDGKVCEAVAWLSPYLIKSDSYCRVGSIDPIVNLTLPGDFCDTASECFGEEGKVYCNGVCQTTVRVGDYCDATDFYNRGDWACPVGAYCDTELSKCVKQLNEGDVCSSARKCITGFSCVKVNDAKDSTCTKYWSLNVGDKFDAKVAKVTNIIFPLSSVCKTHLAYNFDDTSYECRQAPFNNKADKLSDLRKPDGSWSKCEYTAFDDRYDASKPVQKISYARCGFNKDSAAYCNKHTGDKWFQEQLTKMQAIDFSSIKCHSSSSLDLCGSFNDAISKDLSLHFYRETISTEEGIFSRDSSGYAAYANNDKCVADSITSYYWQGEKPHYNTGTDSVISELIES